MTSELKQSLFVGGLFTATVLAAVLFPTQTDGALLGGSFPNSQWFTVDKFDGYQTKADPSKVSNGANPQGQNTIINDGDRISVRNIGYELPLGSASTTLNPVTSLHTFRKRDGTNILIRSDGSILRWYDATTSTWETLETGFTTGKEFGFADFNINADLQSYVYFGNSEEASRRWNGAITNINGAVAASAATITVDSSVGFDNAPGYVIYCGQRQVYTSKTDTVLTMDAGANTVACSDNVGLAQAPTSTADVPRGNLFMVANNRLFVAGVTSTPQAVYFSGYTNAANFGVTTSTILTDTTAESPGIFNLAEGGGGVIGMVQDENAIYFFKNSIIYRATLTDALYTLTALKSFDGGKSQTTGAKSAKSIFAGGNGIFFITPDNQIMNLARVEEFDSPQIVPISDPIKPTTDAANFASSTGIFWRDKAYIAAKTNSDSAVNDAIFVYNFRKGAWESPITGWNVWTWAIYDDGGGEDLYFGHARNPDVYRVTTIPLDDVFGVTANWRSKQFDFGLPHHQKEIENVFLEGYIADNTTLSISLLLDEDGYTQTYTTDLLGTETSFLFNAPVFNLFGLTQFGSQRFGTQDDASGKKKFRVYLNKNFKRAPFYNAQLEFASDGENMQWEVTRFGMQVRETDQPLNKNLFRAW